MVFSIDAATLTNVILDTLVRMNISLSKCRDQCYDGASNMSGAKKSVPANITSKEARAVYIHCYGQALNLTVGDTVKRSKVMRDSLDTVFEMSRLIKYSPRRDTMLEQLKRESAQRIPKPIPGMKTQTQNFHFLFWVFLGYEILRHTDNLCRTLQRKDLSAAEEQSLTELALSTLGGMRKEESFSKFWASLNEMLDELNVNEPTLPRRGKMPKRFEPGNAPPEFPPSAKDLYRQQHFEALDLVVNCVKDRFNQPGYQVYRHLVCTWRQIIPRGD